jgi:hypothetical protein
MHATDMTNTRRIELAAKVAGVMPDGLRGRCASYFTQGGAAGHLKPPSNLPVA